MLETLKANKQTNHKCKDIGLSRRQIGKKVPSKETNLVFLHWLLSVGK